MDKFIYDSLFEQGEDGLLEGILSVWCDSSDKQSIEEMFTVLTAYPFSEVGNFSFTEAFQDLDPEGLGEMITDIWEKSTDRPSVEELYFQFTGHVYGQQ